CRGAQDGPGRTGHRAGARRHLPVGPAHGWSRAGVRPGGGDLLSLRGPLRAGHERSAERVTMDREFSIAEGGLSFALPKWRRVAQTIDAPRVDSIPATVALEMRKLEPRVRPGMSVAVGVGSRGVARPPEILP